MYNNNDNNNNNKKKNNVIVLFTITHLVSMASNGTDQNYSQIKKKKKPKLYVHDKKTFYNM